MNSLIVQSKTKEVLSQLRASGMLMCHDSELPSATALIAEEKIQGSWWPHPKGSIIFHALGNILDSKDIIAPKFINGKVTLIDKDLFGAFYSIVSTPQSWQFENLKKDSIDLYHLIMKKGIVQSDRFDWKGERKMGDVVRDLEKKLLVYCTEIHTDSGAHAKRIQTWKQYFKAENLRTIEYEEALSVLELFSYALGESVKLPWF